MISSQPIPDVEKRDENNNVISTITTRGSTSPNGTITLNSNMLDQATDLAVAATIMHEMIHAYLLCGTNNLEGEELKRFSSAHFWLFDTENPTMPLPGTNPFYSIAHRNELARTYIDSVAEILQIIALTKGITSPPSGSGTLIEYCKDIIWGSLLRRHHQTLQGQSQTVRKNIKRNPGLRR